MSDNFMELMYVQKHLNIYIHAHIKMKSSIHLKIHYIYLFVSGATCNSWFLLNSPVESLTCSFAFQSDSYESACYCQYVFCRMNYVISSLFPLEPVVERIIVFLPPCGFTEQTQWIITQTMSSWSTGECREAEEYRKFPGTYFIIYRVPSAL